MANQQESKLEAHTEENESIFTSGMIWIVRYTGIVVEKGRASLIECNTVLCYVLSVLDFVPDEVYILHIYSLYTLPVIVNRVTAN
jgi:hypothetical protein